MRCQHPQRRNQDPLRLFLSHRLSAPSLAEGPLAHAPLQADHVPHTGAGRAEDATQRLHRLVHAAPSMELVVVQIRVATPSRNPEDRQRPERVEVGDDERRLEVLGGIVHRLVIVPARSILPSVSTVRW